MLRRPKHSTIEVIAPKEEEEENEFWVLIYVSHYSKKLQSKRADSKG
jgi:hypothetical protein